MDTHYHQFGYGLGSRTHIKAKSYNHSSFRNCAVPLLLDNSRDKEGGGVKFQPPYRLYDFQNARIKGEQQQQQNCQYNLPSQPIKADGRDDEGSDKVYFQYDDWKLVTDEMMKTNNQINKIMEHFRVKIVASKERPNHVVYISSGTKKRRQSTKENISAWLTSKHENKKFTPTFLNIGKTARNSNNTRNYKQQQKTEIKEKQIDMEEDYDGFIKFEEVSETEEESEEEESESEDGGTDEEESEFNVGSHEDEKINISSKVENEYYIAGSSTNHFQPAREESFVRRVRLTNNEIPPSHQYDAHSTLTFSQSLEMEARRSRERNSFLEPEPMRRENVKSQHNPTVDRSGGWFDYGRSIWQMGCERASDRRKQNGETLQDISIENRRRNQQRENIRKFNLEAERQRNQRESSSSRHQYAKQSSHSQMSHSFKKRVQWQSRNNFRLFNGGHSRNTDRCENEGRDKGGSDNRYGYRRTRNAGGFRDNMECSRGHFRK